MQAVSFSDLIFQPPAKRGQVGVRGGQVFRPAGNPHVVQAGPTLQVVQAADYLMSQLTRLTAQIKQQLRPDTPTDARAVIQEAASELVAALSKFETTTNAGLVAGLEDWVNGYVFGGDVVEPVNVIQPGEIGELPADSQIFLNFLAQIETLVQKVSSLNQEMVEQAAPPETKPILGLAVVADLKSSVLISKHTPSSPTDPQPSQAQTGSVQAVIGETDTVTVASAPWPVAATPSQETPGRIEWASVSGQKPGAFTPNPSKSDHPAMPNRSAATPGPAKTVQTESPGVSGLEPVAGDNLETPLIPSKPGAFVRLENAADDPVVISAVESAFSRKDRTPPKLQQGQDQRTGLLGPLNIGTTATTTMTDRAAKVTAQVLLAMDGALDVDFGFLTVGGLGTAESNFVSDLGASTALNDRSASTDVAARSQSSTVSRFGDAILAQIRAETIGEGLTLVELKPRGLGVIEIEVKSDADGAISVVVRADNSAVLSVLRELREPLGQMINIGSGGTLSFEDKPSEYGGFFDRDGRGSGQGDRALAEGQDIVSVAAAADRQVIGGGQLDITT